MNPIKHVLAAMVSVAALATPLHAMAADAYPTRPIRLLVPFGPGGITDLIARQLAQGMGAKLGQQIVVENKPSAGHIVAMQTTVQAAPDGYTVMLGSNTGLTVAPHMYKDLGFDVGSLQLIAPVITAPTVLVARPEYPANNMADLVRIAKSKPGGINYASFGAGSSAHLGMEIIKKDLGLEATHVPYRGDAPVYTALMGKQVDVGFMTMFSAKQRLETGELKALATLQAERMPGYPSIQSTVEAGAKNSNLPVWIALFAPPGTSPAIMTKLEEVTRSVVASDEFGQFLRSRGAEPMTMTNARMHEFIKSQSAKIEPIVQEIGLKPGQ
ncbi:tripartite tricarboxylate transporter substrate binding protein [Ramlibacter sp. AN1015]|uniref:Bug family tripartite tricarboxylate transporter substrate binding protein n=1 Tax=Ramlibacter sp. AN1015 TaxID=3133428 RepID=UPI0030C56672